MVVTIIRLLAAVVLVALLAGWMAALVHAQAPGRCHDDGTHVWCCPARVGVCLIAGEDGEVET